MRASPHFLFFMAHKLRTVSTFSKDCGEEGGAAGGKGGGTRGGSSKAATIPVPGSQKIKYSLPDALEKKKIANPWPITTKPGNT